MGIEEAIKLLKDNGYSVIKINKGYCKQGSLKEFWTLYQGEKINFVCFKSRLRWAGILSTWREAGDISRAFEPKDMRLQRRQDNIDRKIQIINNL